MVRPKIKIKKYYFFVWKDYVFHNSVDNIFIMKKNLNCYFLKMSLARLLSFHFSTTIKADEIYQEIGYMEKFLKIYLDPECKIPLIYNKKIITYINDGALKFIPEFLTNI